MRRGSLSYPSTEVRECTRICRRRRPLWTPVATSGALAADDDCVAEDICRGGRAGARVGRSGGDVRASDGRDCAAPMSARDPLEMVAVDLQTLSFPGIKRQFHGRRDPIVDSRKEVLPLEPQPIGNAVASDRLRLRPGRSTRYTVAGRFGYTGAIYGGRQRRSGPRTLLGARLCGGAETGAVAATKSHRLGCDFGGSHGRQKAR